MVTRNVSDKVTGERERAIIAMVFRIILTQQIGHQIMKEVYDPDRVLLGEIWTRYGMI